VNHTKDAHNSSSAETVSEKCECYSALKKPLKTSSICCVGEIFLSGSH